jgi:hypothetical protein
MRGTRWVSICASYPAIRDASDSGFGAVFRGTLCPAGMLARQMPPADAPAPVLVDLGDDPTLTAMTRLTRYALRLPKFVIAGRRRALDSTIRDVFLNAKARWLRSCESVLPPILRSRAMHAPAAGARSTGV